MAEAAYLQCPSAPARTASDSPLPEAVLDSSVAERRQEQVESVSLVGAAEVFCERPASGAAAPEPPCPAEAVEDAGASPKKDFVMRHLTKLTILGVAVGVLLGLICAWAEAPADLVRILAFPGDLFIRALKVVIVPMIFCSMVVGVSSMFDMVSSSGAVGKLCAGYFLGTTALASVEGVLLFNIFRPGRKLEGPLVEPDPSYGGSTVQTSQYMLDVLFKTGQSLVPDNIVKAMAETQLLGVIVFAICFGVCLRPAPNSKAVFELLEAVNVAMLNLIGAIIYFTPVGVASMVAGAVGKHMNTLGMMGLTLVELILVVFAGQLMHVFLVYPALYFFFHRKGHPATPRNPYRFLLGLTQAWVTAFGTSSSAATLSTTMRCCHAQHVPELATRLVLPIGCTVNMDGSALERPIVILFVARLAGLSLPAVQQAVVVLVSALGSIGASPIPSAGLVGLVAMIEATGVPVIKAIAFLLAIEWLLDSVRTTVNVTGDAVGAAIIGTRLGAGGSSPVECTAVVVSAPS
eukprot:RCo054705